MAQKIITYSFYLLFFFTPLFFSPLNSELFEFNKMMLVYFLTTLITGAWIIKMVNSKLLIVNRTPLDIPLMLFLLSQILSTIFSIDHHTSLFGYYSRSNGGLLSIISYILLFFALVSNFNWVQTQKFLKAALLGGLVVSLYAIPEHFGVSPSCILLQHTFTADCWVQDVQARVFATLGQPNWLAAYLGMLIFPALYFALTAKTKQLSITYYLLTIIYYLAFTFSYSRGALIGFLTGLGAFIFLLPFCHPEATSRRISGLVPATLMHLKQVKRFLAPLGMTLVVLLLINLLFGSALTGDFRLLKAGSVTARPGLTQTTSVGTQLENGGTESGQIRLIVWRGALEIFKHYPLFGSGVETFAYSYYNFRPVEHNLVSEWDFLYNKAHNEYLNYLATTGIVGFVSYMLLIGSFIWWCIKEIINYKVQSIKKDNLSFIILTLSLLSSYIVYLIQDFFGFSVVIVALFFFLFPGFAFLAAENIKPWTFNKGSILSKLARLLYSRSFYSKLACWLIGMLTLLTLFTLVKNWRADTYYKTGQDATSTNPGRAYNYFFDAVSLNGAEPLYRIELGGAAASAAVSIKGEDATTSAYLKDQAVEETQKALNTSPANTSLWRAAILTYYELSLLDPKYQQTTLEIFNKVTSLAPTDPKLLYNKAIILEQFSQTDEEIKVLVKTLQLKPNYLEAYFKLGEAYQKKGDLTRAKQQFETILHYTPTDPGAIQKLQEITASQSAALN